MVAELSEVWVVELPGALAVDFSETLACTSDSANNGTGGSSLLWYSDGITLLELRLGRIGRDGPASGWFAVVSSFLKTFLSRIGT